MGKYSELMEDIFSIFGTPEWKAEKITTVPDNFVTSSLKEEFIRISIIPSKVGFNLGSVSGIMIVDIFVQAGNGPKRSFYIADKLDLYLAGKSVTNETGKVVQFMSSTFTVDKQDIDNPSFFRSSYTIPFSYSEVK